MAAEAAAVAGGVRIISRCTIRPPSPRPGEEDGGRVIHLTPWDLKLISVDYIQKGILFRNPNPQQQQEDDDSVISALRTSFAATLDRFFPFAGRLVVTQHDPASSGFSPSSLSISLRCDDRGAEFVHASAAAVRVSDVLDSLYTPPVVKAFFPLNGAINYDGQHLPLLSVQATELADGVFIAGSLNHSVADGSSFWHFMNSWSELCRTGRRNGGVLNQPPFLDRWFVDSYEPPIRLPFESEGDFIVRPVYAPVEECFFHFPAASVAKLKAKANAEMGTVDRISSLQALLARLWISVTRARGLDPRQETSYTVIIGCRTRLTPPLPETYLGNSLLTEKITVTVEELLEGGLGRGAWLLNRFIASYEESTIRKMVEDWPAAPSFAYIQSFEARDLATGSSPRFDVYGNDFGWGKPVAVRSGVGNKLDGKATVYPGPEKGSVGFEVCLSAMALGALVKDEEFMELVASSDG